MADKLIDKEILKENVELINQQVDDKTMEYFYTKDTSKIQILTLGKNWISSVGLIAFRQANWESLLILRLWGNKISDKGCKYLSQAHLPKLKWLNLGKNQISHLGVMHISKASWKQFNQIFLFHNRISNDSIRWLIKANWKIVSYYLSFNQIQYFEAQQLTLFQIAGIFRIEIGIYAHIEQTTE